MFAPAMTFWNEKAPLNIVKVDKSARDEFDIYMHELNTDAQSDMMFTDWLFGGDDLRYEDPASADWLDDMANDWWGESLEEEEEELNRWAEEEMYRDIDHINYGLGCHESGCERCDARSRVIQLEIDHSHGDRHSMSAGCISCREDEYRGDEGLVDYTDFI